MKQTNKNKSQSNKSPFCQLDERLWISLSLSFFPEHCYEWPGEHSPVTQERLLVYGSLGHCPAVLSTHICTHLMCASLTILSPGTGLTYAPSWFNSFQSGGTQQQETHPDTLMCCCTDRRLKEGGREAGSLWGPGIWRQRRDLGSQAWPASCQHWLVVLWCTSSPEFFISITLGIFAFRCYPPLVSIPLFPMLPVFSRVLAALCVRDLSRDSQGLSRRWQNFCYWSFGGFPALPA